ncbi:MAG: hypothetical protein ACSLFR_00550 [Solirubrobacteraceae bacterium]
MSASSADDPLGEAIVVMLAKAGAADLLRFMTDREIAVTASVSAARVRRAFSRRPGTEQLDRRQMLEVAVVKALDELDVVHADRASRWRRAARQGQGRPSGSQVANALLDVSSMGGERDLAKIVGLALALAHADDTVRDLLSYASRRRTAHYRAAVCDLLSNGRCDTPRKGDVEALALLATLIGTHIAEPQRIGLELERRVVVEAFARAWDAVVTGRGADGIAVEAHVAHVDRDSAMYQREGDGS